MARWKLSALLLLLLLHVLHQGSQTTLSYTLQCTIVQSEPPGAVFMIVQSVPTGAVCMIVQSEPAGVVFMILQFVTTGVVCSAV